MNALSEGDLAALEAVTMEAIDTLQVGRRWLTAVQRLKLHCLQQNLTAIRGHIRSLSLSASADTAHVDRPAGMEFDRSKATLQS